ncbi:hypothetical protein theurythT_28900 [Thalassotalea eurytherma]|uniref:Uncharacterized protein n=1 Tax=Thalassotalea eurytherma TaxID=1144278 RepID=A0ABQ6H730_9GAMM|nr:hypothetical protein theurythT_28900 [Thalassotalea eurytherma]
MISDSLKLKTISPFSSPLNIVLGIDHLSKSHHLFLQRLAQSNERFTNIHQDKPKKDYQDIEVDTRDIRLLMWASSEFPELRIHVFPNAVAIAEIDITVEGHLTAKAVGDMCSDKTEVMLADAYPQFFKDLRQACSFEKNDILTFDDSNTQIDIKWTARALTLEKSQLSQAGIDTFLKNWLKDTQRPEDAADIIAGLKTYSLTWLNYVLIDRCQQNEDPRISTMVLAQYYYCAQENCNSMLKDAIDNAYNGSDMSITEKKLAQSRVATRLHQIDFHEHLKYLNRFKRKLIHDILSSWDFEQMTANGQRMIEVCSSRLEEVDNKRRERSTVMTDLLLVTLSFFAVFELSLYLTEFSREVMSRPALDYHDDGRSFFLEFFANVDVDVMFTFGFGLTFALVVIYVLIKGK